MFCECHNLLVRCGRTVVLDIERLAIPTGRITAIRGANGAGKTTLLEIIALLRRPARGEVRLWDCTGRAAQRLQRKIVMVMHPGYLFRGSVWDNVVYGLKARGVPRDETRRRASEAMEIVRLSHLACRRSTGLSAGERQRVNLARAIAVDPEAILLDEPVANVDTETAAIVCELLSRLRDQRGTTVVYTSPGNTWMQPTAHQIVTLAAGRVQEQDCQP